jgi:hypothetical protein
VFGGSGSPIWALFAAAWLDAAVFGAVLALLSRSGGVRLAMLAALLFVAGIVLPTLLGFSSRLPLYEWAVIAGAVPSMSAGAALCQVIRRRRRD